MSEDKYVAGGMNFDLLDKIMGNYNGNSAVVPQGVAADPSWSQKWLTGYTDPDTKTGVDSYAKTGLGLGMSALDAFMGMKQYGLMKDQLNFQKKAFNTNMDNQRTLTNAQLRDRQNARSQYSSSFQPVSEYMDQNRI